MESLSNNPAALRVRNRPVRVDICFAKRDGVLKTLEGEVRYASGDALARGQLGDEWPIPRDRFWQTYEPDGDFSMGQDGAYRKKPVTLLAVQLTVPFEVTLSGGRGRLSGKPGDWLVEFSSEDWGIVNDAVFATTYEILDQES